MYHFLIGLMSVNADIVTSVCTPRKHLFKNTMLYPSWSNAVNRSIGQGRVDPFPLFNVRVCGIFSYDKNKSTTNLITYLIYYYITHALLNVFFHLGPLWIPFNPLGGITILCHLLACIREYCKQYFYILICGFSDNHQCPRTKTPSAWFSTKQHSSECSSANAVSCSCIYSSYVMRRMLLYYNKTGNHLSPVRLQIILT